MNGGEPIAITGKTTLEANRWSPDNRVSFFLARKKEDDKAQVWILTEWEAMQKY
jgi:hypothetical protein